MFAFRYLLAFNADKKKNKKKHSVVCMVTACDLSRRLLCFPSNQMMKDVVRGAERQIDRLSLRLARNMQLLHLVLTRELRSFSGDIVPTLFPCPPLPSPYEACFTFSSLSLQSLHLSTSLFALSPPSSPIFLSSVTRKRGLSEPQPVRWKVAHNAYRRAG